ncbi:MAG: alpha/beta fold hydrolase [bacterium]|nr:alpha/beta fold hydrolase [bacterium]
MNSKKSTVKGNSPLTEVPSDYCPEECGSWFTIPEGIDAGKKIFFRDSTHGSGEEENTIVFVHGNPECSYVYRNVIKHIIANSQKKIRIVAMDHIGFGLSDRASFEMVDMDHSANLLQLIQNLNLKKVTLVVHDWGGPIGIGAFLKESHRVINLVITNTTVFPIPEKGYTYKNYPMRLLPWSKLPDLISSSQWGNMAAYIVSTKPAGSAKLIWDTLIYILLSKLKIRKLNDAQKIYKKQMSVKENVRSSKRFVRQTPYWGKGNVYKEPTIGMRDTAPFYSFIHENIKSAWGDDGQQIGVRAVLGRWDPLGKDEVVSQWKEHLPQLEGHVRIFDDVGHFIEEFKPEEIGQAIVDVANLGS